MFLAILTGLGASALFRRLYLHWRQRRSVLLTGADIEFGKAIASLSPLALTVGVYAALSTLIIRLSHVDSIRMALNTLFNWIFSFGQHRTIHLRRLLEKMCPDFVTFS